MKLIIGIDETGTERQLSDGWCYFGIPEQAFMQFESDANVIKSQHNISGFHANKYRSNQATAYKDFLKLIKRYIEQQPISICSSVLYRKDWNQNLTSFAERVFSGATRKAGIENQDATKIAKKILPPLFTLCRITENIGSSESIDVYFDSDDLKSQIENHDLIYDNTIGITLKSGIGITANVYKKQNHPNAPQINNSEIQVLDDEKSMIIQAADVIGNFATAYIYKMSGSTSANRIEKATIFNYVFSGWFKGINFSQTVVMVGENDLQLINDAAALPLVMGRC